MSEDSFRTWKMMMEAGREERVTNPYENEIKAASIIKEVMESKGERKVPNPLEDAVISASNFASQYTEKIEVVNTNPDEEPGEESSGMKYRDSSTIHFPYGATGTYIPGEYVSFGSPPISKKRPTTNLIDSTVKTSVKNKSSSTLPKKRNPLEGVLEEVDGQILKLFLTRRRSFVIGWFDFVEENFRQLMLMHRFTSSGGITIYARETPAMDTTTILIPGIRRDGDEGHILYQFRNTEDATEYFFKYLEAFEELSALVRGKPKPDSNIGTKFNIPYTHIF